MSMSKPFLSDVQTLRKNARKHLQSGAVTEGYRGDRKQVLALLNTSLATELVCVLRYRRHYYMASGIHAKSIAAEFLQHAKDEQEHADMIARRIVQLDGEPDFAPKGLAERSQSEYIEGSDLVEMLEEDLVAERLVIDTPRPAGGPSAARMTPGFCVCRFSDRLPIRRRRRSAEDADPQRPQNTQIC